MAFTRKCSLGILSVLALIALQAPTPEPPAVDKAKLLKKLQKTNFDRLYPPTNLPEHHRYLGFIVTGKINGQELYGTAVPLIALEDKSFDPPTIGEIPIGTPITLESVQAFKGRHFYRIKRKDGQAVPDNAWLDGMFVAPTGQVNSTPD